MIIQCGSCSRKFVVRDQDIPKKGRKVQCGYCSVTWHQMPAPITSKVAKKIIENKNDTNTNEDLSDKIISDKIR